MFGFFDAFMKQINEQATEYATTQSGIARRLWGQWVDPFQALQPAKVVTDRRSRGPNAHRETGRHGRHF